MESTTPKYDYKYSQLKSCGFPAEGASVSFFLWVYQAFSKLGLQGIKKRMIQMLKSALYLIYCIQSCVSNQNTLYNLRMWEICLNSLEYNWIITWLHISCAQDWTPQN